MSVVVAVRFKDGIVIGSDKRATYAGRITFDTCTKVYQTAYSRHAIGTVGSLRDVNLIGVKDEWIILEDILAQTEIDERYVVGNIIPQMIAFFDANGRLLQTSEGEIYSESQFLYVTQERIFVINSDFGVIEMPDWAAIGCGQEMVMGYLSNIEIDNEEDYFENLDVQSAADIVINAIAKACSRDSAVSEEVDDIYVITNKTAEELSIEMEEKEPEPEVIEEPKKKSKKKDKN